MKMYKDNFDEFHELNKVLVEETKQMLDGVRAERERKVKRESWRVALTTVFAFAVSMLAGYGLGNLLGYSLGNLLR